MKVQRIFGSLVLSLFLSSFPVYAATMFYYTSSPMSWVGHGETVLVTPNDGYDFFPSRGYDNSVFFAINNFGDYSDFGNSRWWYLNFVAPKNAPLTVGSYPGATRYPFQNSISPGLSFIGNGRGDNELTGEFSVLEVSYAGNGDVLSFAANFLQYDEKIHTWWNVGAIRYNSSVAITGLPDPFAIPEPSSLALVFLGLLFVLIPWRKECLPINLIRNPGLKRAALN